MESLLAMERAGKRVPTLETQPDLPIYLVEALSCYVMVITEKQIGMAVGPVPYSAIVNWASVAGITDADDIDDLANTVWLADSMVSAHHEKKSKQGTLGGKQGPGKPLPPPTGKVIGGKGGN